MAENTDSFFPSGFLIQFKCVPVTTRALLGISGDVDKSLHVLPSSLGVWIQAQQLHLRIEGSGGHCSAAWGKRHQDLVCMCWGLPSVAGAQHAQSPRSALHRLRDAAPGARTTLSAVGLLCTNTVLVINSNTPETWNQNPPFTRLRNYLLHLHPTPSPHPTNTPSSCRPGPSAGSR